MTSTEALVTAARKYCREHYSYWAARYSAERTGKDFPDYIYTDEDYNLFPRYNVLAAILGEVEMLTRHTWTSLDQCRTTLAGIGATAASPFTVSENDIESKAIQEERDKFIHFIQTIAPDTLAQVAPLPYRRRLSAEEREAIRSALLERWNYDGDYWDPLDYKCPEAYIYLAKKNIRSEDYQAIIGFITQHAVSNLLEITEDHTDSEVALSEFDPNCYETLYCDHSYQWVIYGSHEATITFAGAPLLDFIRQQFSGREALFNQWPS